MVSAKGVALTCMAGAIVTGGLTGVYPDVSILKAAPGVLTALAGLFLHPPGFPEPAPLPPPPPEGHEHV